MFHKNENKKKAAVAILTSGKIDFKTKGCLGGSVKYLTRGFRSGLDLMGCGIKLYMGLHAPRRRGTKGTKWLPA